MNMIFHVIFHLFKQGMGKDGMNFYTVEWIVDKLEGIEPAVSYFMLFYNNTLL